MIIRPKTTVFGHSDNNNDNSNSGVSDNDNDELVRGIEGAP